VIESVAEGLDGSARSARRRKSIALLALLAGGVSLARAVHDPELSEEIASAIRHAVLSLRTPTAAREAR
jgi:TetR/AcrR family transcriptional regulator, transcriptional repressor for nem operon